MDSRHSVPLEELRTFTFSPDGPVRAAAILLHGHGDYSSRYGEILRPFIDRGVACLATDLPGHGESPGRRGFVPGTGIVDEVTTANLERARQLCPNGPIGLLGHSVGGLLALREVLHRQDRYHFAWFSSPLLRPESTRRPMVVSFLQKLGRLFPRLSLSTGVTSGDCWHAGGDPPEDIADDEWFHNRISLGWGTRLVDIAREVREGFRSRTLHIPALFTQGGADPVCPPQFLRDFLAEADIPRLTHHEFADQLHEPFVDSGREEVRAALGHWLDAVLDGRE